MVVGVALQKKKSVWGGWGVGTADGADDGRAVKIFEWCARELIQ